MADKNGIPVTVNAGEHDRDGCPVIVEVDNTKVRALAGGPVSLIDLGSGAVIPAQCEPSGDGKTATLSWILDGLNAHQEQSYTLSPEGVEGSGVVFSDSENAIDVTIGGRAFTTFRYGRDQFRPYFFPVLGPEGRAVTRGETSEISTDHVHHRSLYVAYGEVNDVDVWGEGENSGRVVHQGFTQRSGGVVVGRIYTQNDWVNKAGQKLMSDRQNFRIYSTPETGAIIDLDLTLIASAGDVHFGDTKEGGIISIRVNPSMNASDGGRIENAYGGVNEAETWGKRAQWCDYSGVVDGAHVGIAVFDHLTNPRYPTYWHVRNYGLMTTNIFGSGTFEGDRNKDGSYTLESGSEMNFRFRVYIHAGDASDGKVAQKYHDFINPPAVTVS
ncbi:MAG: PmoA family protein [Candidatus Poribacteria bacterium]|nr:PmoA family protein [Candidatus Poribacteria bacterium]